MSDNPQKINISQVTDDIISRSGSGTRSQILQDTTRGINLIGASQPTITNHQSNGLVFFTRPMLNLTQSNLKLDRVFDEYADAPEMSYPRMARVMLDPINERNQLIKDNKNRMVNDPHDGSVTSPLVDPFNPFMPILTNTLSTLSGWPDPAMNVYVSDKGILGEQWMKADGHMKIYENFSLTTNFMNTDGDPIFHLFYLWTHYMGLITQGKISMRPQMRAARRMDYFTRIISFALDPTRTFITHWANTGVGFPTIYGGSSIHDYDVSKRYKSNQEQKSIQFQCLGAEYNDLITLVEFNKLVGRFNPDLNIYHPAMGGINTTNGNKDLVPYGNFRTRGSKTPAYVKLTANEKAAGNFHAYPLINIYTKELEWWMRFGDWAKYVAGPELRLMGKTHQEISGKAIPDYIGKRINPTGGTFRK